ncbi:K02A2.6-like [Cordylochernes scorpioides]|uniref:RNA-directed DNA polymerase n=1 Tax=Cordylochernes scorpioides TaxID=51811 RepID=A0ABY6L1P8_9ARAC|nr:K02A2.6-like [Cordylochernes scorpioides]
MDYGLGVILSHRNDRKEECPIAFASRTLTEAEKRYSQLEKEALSITYGDEKSRQFLLGRKFVLVTDNRPLIHIFSPQKPIPICAASRIKRWSLKLAAFNYTEEFRKGSDNSNVDALSRLPLESSVREFLDEDQVLLLRKLNEVPFSFREVAYETSRDKILSIVLRNVREGNCVCIDSNIKELTRECRVCQESASMPSATISEWTWPEKPWHRLNLDLADNRRQFVSGEFEQFTKMNGIRHTKTSPYNPSTNGLAERYVREFKNLLRKNNGKDDLETNLQSFLFAHRASPQIVIKEFPGGTANEEKFKIKILEFNTKMRNPREVFHEAVRRQEQFTTGCEVYFRNYATGPKREEEVPEITSGNKEETASVHVPSCTPKPEAAAVQVPVRSPRPQRARKPLDRLEREQTGNERKETDNERSDKTHPGDGNFRTDRRATRGEIPATESGLPERHPRDNRRPHRRYVSEQPDIHRGIAIRHAVPVHPEATHATRTQYFPFNRADSAKGPDPVQQIFQASHTKPKTPQWRLFETKVGNPPNDTIKLTLDLYLTQDLPCTFLIEPDAAVNAYKEFIPDHARLRTPLVHLLKKDVVWVWDDECQKAFTNLKENLTTHPTLHLYQEGLPCQVYCNTSTFSITGVLKQVYPDGKTYTVQHFSRSLRSHERNYSDLELQCLAIVESVDNFRTCLMDRKFTIFSDHPALQWLKEIKAPSGKLFRWRLRLSRYEYEVRSINGVQQYETGVVTRIPFCGFLDASLIKNQQSSPPGKSRVTMDPNKLRTVSRKGVLKTIVPNSFTTRLLKSVHTQHHHPNISKMTRLISAQYYWQNMTQDIAKQVKTCPTCRFARRIDEYKQPARKNTDTGTQTKQNSYIKHSVHTTQTMPKLPHPRQRKDHTFQPKPITADISLIKPLTIKQENCKPDNQSNHITPLPKDIKQENCEPTNHSNSTIHKDVSNIRRSYKRQATKHFRTKSDIPGRAQLSSREAAGLSEDSTLSRSTNRKRACDISRPIRETLRLGVKSKDKNCQLRFGSQGDLMKYTRPGLTRAMVRNYGHLMDASHFAKADFASLSPNECR